MGRIRYPVPPAAELARRPLLKDEPRTLIWRESSPGGRPAVAKLYRRRGLATFLRSSMTRFRTEREHRRLEHLVRAGVPCPEPLGWASDFSRDHGFHEVLITAELPGAVALDDHLEAGADPAALASLFRSVRRMHESGLCHQALYASNILVLPDEPPARRYYIADVPRSWTFPTTIVGTIMAELDLLDLLWTIARAGPEVGAIPVEAYGRDGVTEAWWEDEPGEVLERGCVARSKAVRARRDISVRACWAAAWALHSARRMRRARRR